MTGSPQSMSERMTAAARELQDQVDPATTVESAVDLLVQNVPGCEAASISLVYGKRRVETPAATNDLATRADQLQGELAEGPALDTLWTEETVYVPELADDPRWPTWGPRLTEATKVRSVLTFRLFTLKDVIGALSMYSTQPDAFDEDDKAEGLALASHIAIAVIAAQKLGNYESALDSRTIIAQACGIVMERYGLDADRAFALLVRLSTSQNVKLRTIASEVVLTRILPAAPPGTPE